MEIQIDNNIYQQRQWWERVQIKSKTRRIFTNFAKQSKDLSSKYQGHEQITHRNHFEALIEQHEDWNLAIAEKNHLKPNQSSQMQPKKSN